MEPTEIVIQALVRWAKNRNFTEQQTKELITDTKYDALNRCWFFIRNGMFHGVEADGHIHT